VSHLLPGDIAPPFTARTIKDKVIFQPNQGAPVLHLQFRRFAGCPVCNFHLLTMSRRRDELMAAGIDQIVLFHSSVEEMLKYQAQLPFDCVADPDKRLYRQYGVETSLRALLHPRVLLNGARWILAARRFYRKAENGILGLPADFLIVHGRVVAVKYGKHADDHWEVDELLHIAKGSGQSLATACAS
jgi:peroxiredoxin